jgi:branched-chain amino acid transport system substrate-binding protein
VNDVDTVTTLINAHLGGAQVKEAKMKRVLISAIATMTALGWANLAQAQVKVGVAAPITGAAASNGEQLVRGVKRAADDINAAGGILGQKIEIETGDDVSDPKQGVSVANKFVGDGIKFVIGHFNSGVTIPASEVYLDNGIVFVTPAATNPKVTERGLWNAFRTCGRDDQQATVWAELAVGKLKDKKIAILHDKTTYGQGLAEVTRKDMNAGGKKEVLYEGVNVGEKDYTAVVSKIKASGADYVMWGGLYTEGGLILRQMRDQGVQATMISGDGITNNEFSAIAGPATEGTLMTFGSEPRDNPAAKAVVDEFRKVGFDPAGYTLYSYAGMQILKQAAEQAKSLDPKKVAEVMHSGVTFKTVLGDISYDKKGDRTSVDYVWYVWKKGDDGKITYKQM